MRKHAKRAVYAFCPVCLVPVPALEITVELTGFLRRRCDVLVDGDASDYVAHMWSHQQDARVER